MIHDFVVFIILLCVCVCVFQYEVLYEIKSLISICLSLKQQILAATSYASLPLTRSVTSTPSPGTSITKSSSSSLTLTLPDGKTCIGGTSSNLLRTIGALSPASGLSGSSGPLDSSHVDGWLQYIITSLEIPLEALMQAKSSKDSVADMVDSVKTDFNNALKVLEHQLQFKTYMVGHSVTLVDISACCALYQALSFQLWDSSDENLVNVNRWYQTVTHQTFFESALGLLSSSTTTSSAVVATASSSSASSDGIALSGVAPGVQPKLYNRERVRVKELLGNTSYIGKSVTVAGWARTTRNANKGKLLFLELNDGSCGTSLQCVLDDEGTENFLECKGAGGTGASFWIQGEVVESPAKGQVRVFCI